MRIVGITLLSVGRDTIEKTARNGVKSAFIKCFVNLIILNKIVFLIDLIENAVFLCLESANMERKIKNETKKQSPVMPHLSDGQGHIFA